LSTLPRLQHGSREEVFIRVHSWLQLVVIYKIARTTDF